MEIKTIVQKVKCTVTDAVYLSPCNLCHKTAKLCHYLEQTLLLPELFWLLNLETDVFLQLLLSEKRMGVCDWHGLKPKFLILWSLHKTPFLSLLLACLLPANWHSAAALAAGFMIGFSFALHQQQRLLGRVCLQWSWSSSLPFSVQ